MSEELTDRQKEILRYIREQVKEKGYPPSVREIGEAVGLRSSSTVHGHLARLQEKGYLRRDPTKPRAIELRGGGGPREARTGRLSARHLPLIGTVTAGQPILAEENIEGHLPVPASWVHEDDAFLLRVRGESMIEAGICDGDLVVVRRQPQAQNGEIVVALLGDEATVKRFYKEPGRVRLQPENPVMEPIYTRDVQILGKVVGLLRQIH